MNTGQTGIGRRSFLRLLPTLPFAAKATAETVAKAGAEAAFVGHANSLSGMTIGAPQMPLYHTVLRDPKLRMLAKAGKLPEWARRSLLESTEPYARSVHPEIAQMRSVSLATKLRMNRNRILAELFRDVEHIDAWEAATKAFFTDERPCL